MTQVELKLGALKIQVHQLEKTVEFGGPSEVCGAIDCVSLALEELKTTYHDSFDEALPTSARPYR